MARSRLRPFPPRLLIRLAVALWVFILGMAISLQIRLCHLQLTITLCGCKHCRFCNRNKPWNLLAFADPVNDRQAVWQRSSRGQILYVPAIRGSGVV